MVTVGITGGIGSGKTTFCREWEKLGAFVLYADDFAKQLMEVDTELIRKIKNTFGADSYNENGKLNRVYLAEEAFSKGRVEELNALVHPVLWDRMKSLADQKEKNGTEVFVEEAAILLNNGRPEHVDYVVLILSNQNKRIKRTIERDHSTQEQIKGRMSKQPDFESLTHLADFVVENDSSVSELNLKAKKIYELVTSG